MELRQRTGSPCLDSRARVLVVERDDTFRHVLVETLRAEGYYPVAAPDIWSALALVFRYGPPPRLILLDTWRDPRDAQAFQNAYPFLNELDAPIIALSLAGEQVNIDRGAVVAVLDKPFDLDDLVRLVREQLSAPSPVV